MLVTKCTGESIDEAKIQGKSEREEKEKRERERIRGDATLTRTAFHPFPRLNSV